MTAQKATKRTVFLRKLETFVKTFLSSVLTILLYRYNEGEDVMSFDPVMWKAIFGAAIFSNLPVIINALNPNYKGYGIQKKKTV